MSQQFQVLKCFKCSTFQVHQVKKSTKWECKMCGEKQSVKRNYGIGTGKECRLHVQKLNSIRGEIAESLDTLKFEKESNEYSESLNNVENCIPSKWTQYVKCEEEMDIKLPEDSESNFRGAEVVLELPKNIPRKRLNRTMNDNMKRLKPPNADSDQPETLHVLSNDNIFIKQSNQITKVPAAKPHIDGIPSNSNFNIGKLTDKSTEPCKLSKDSKWAKFVDENAEIEEVEMDYSSDACKVFEQSKVAKDSKWSQYVENVSGTENSETNLLTSGNTFDAVVKPMFSEHVKGISFSQCSDDDIDRILDF